MLAYGVALDRLKSPGPYVERKFAPRYAAAVYGLEHLRREMQPRSRSGHRAFEKNITPW